MFHLNDRVVCISNPSDKQGLVGKTGTVLSSNQLSVCVEFDDHIHGHAGRGGKRGHCWNAPVKCFELLEEETFDYSLFELEVLI